MQARTFTWFSSRSWTRFSESNEPVGMTVQPIFSKAYCRPQKPMKRPYPKATSARSPARTPIA